ncbi:hypothetical protein AMAG_16871 [Allomyces macrogynus ATCC 38327]|uniref:Major facilitator superfamily (MFS) profile domain-containing protein n=1 Tax=Allomyces macrogynus (strain ATCC 38327) TaxID=578462 RepID=A0A0L0TCE6_ALLM3|nr:hypothetical protein AMAG_16871 [Allomyces macrogynus ATCC 38327]|eukprot:KNE72386.1 hypothetical protein AMAG_16871 [Allomyces macrogynus ATCC 38327]
MPATTIGLASASTRAMSPARTLAPAGAVPAVLRRWQATTLAVLIAMYTGYYCCRTDFSVALPAILKATHISKGAFGAVISYGYAFYAFGKIVNGLLIDRFGGRQLIFLCLFGSILCTIGLGAVSDENATVAHFTWLWSANRIFQSGGWPALTTIIRTWFPPMEHGKAMGIASLSYSLGDAGIRLFFGKVMSAGLSWQRLFFLAAVCGLLLLIPSFYLLHSSPTDLGLPSVAKLDTDIPLVATTTRRGRTTRVAPGTLRNRSKSRSPTRRPASTSRSPSPGHGTSVFLGRAPYPVTDRDLLKAPRPWWRCWGTSSSSPSTDPSSPSLLTQPKYILLLLQSPLFTWIREVFNSWAIVYLAEAFNLDDGQASVVSLGLPLLSALASVGGGFLVDNVARNRRGILYFSLVLGTTLVLSVFALFASTHGHSGMHVPASASAPAAAETPEAVPKLGHALKAPVAPPVPGLATAVLLMSLSSLFSTAPASWAEGLFPLELASASNAGIAVAAVHSAGYVGAILAGKFVGTIVEAKGWPALFVLMSGASLLNTALAAMYWSVDHAALVRSSSAAAGIDTVANGGGVSARRLVALAAGARGAKRGTADYVGVPAQDEDEDEDDVDVDVDDLPMRAPSRRGHDRDNGDVDEVEDEEGEGGRSSALANRALMAATASSSVLRSSSPQFKHG